MTLSFQNLRHARAFNHGRKLWHQRRQRKAELRRHKLVHLLATGRYRANANDELADVLKVSRVTLSRDLQALENGFGRCQNCGQPLPHFVPPADLESED